MRKHWLITILGCLLSNLLTAQSTIPDSLSRLPDDTVKANKLNALASSYRYTDPVKAADITRAAITVSQKTITRDLNSMI